MKHPQLNNTQRRVYEFLVERSRDGVPPSVREIGERVGLLSTSSVQANLDALENMGYITRDPMHKRSIRIAGQAHKRVIHVPLLGTVTAGLPILAVEQIESYLPYTGPVSRDKSLFALRVRGESMINIGILDGDIVFVEKTPTARNGDIVVALLEDEATVKRLRRDNGEVWLLPENPVYDPIAADHCSILGVVASVVREAVH